MVCNAAVCYAEVFCAVVVKPTQLQQLRFLVKHITAKLTLNSMSLRRCIVPKIIGGDEDGDSVPIIISPDRSSYSDGLLCIRTTVTFFRLSLSPLMQLMLRVYSKPLKQYQCN